MTYYLLLGSNLGKREEMIATARKHIAEIDGLSILRQSSIQETKPYGVEDQPDFLNLVIEVESGLAPDDLLCKLQNIEDIMGRERKLKWGPRNIDIDILLAPEIVVRSPRLNLPHIDLHNRAFALELLAEIVPDLVHPTEKKTIAELLESAQNIGE